MLLKANNNIVYINVRKRKYSFRSGNTNFIVNKFLNTKRFRETF